MMTHLPQSFSIKQPHTHHITSCGLLQHQSFRIKQPHTPHTTSCTAPVLQDQTAPHTPHHILYSTSPSGSNRPTHPTPHPVQHQSFRIKQPHTPHTTSCTAPVLQDQTAPHTPHHILYSTSPSGSNRPTHPTPVQHQSFRIKQTHVVIVIIIIITTIVINIFFSSFSFFLGCSFGLVLQR